LAAVLGIVRVHKGRVRLDSQPGRGTTFRILLPATARSATAAPPEPATPANWEGYPKILLVDDEAVARSTGERLLRQIGFVVTTAPDGRVALRLFGAAPDSFACVLLDVTMPHLDGHETLRELRRIRTDIPVIMSSGYERSNASDPASELVSQGFLRKPYGLDELRRELAAALGTPRPAGPEVTQL
jgi:CheY-like chemotaxis protein